MAKVNKFLFLYSRGSSSLRLQNPLCKKKVKLYFLELNLISILFNSGKRQSVIYSASSGFASHPFLLGLPPSSGALSHTMVSMRQEGTIGPHK